MTGRRREGGLFLEQHSYRRRRLRDAARILPILATVLIALPVLWPVGGEDGYGSTRGKGIYLFAVWAGLLVGAALLARALREDVEGPD